MSVGNVSISELSRQNSNDAISSAMQICQTRTTFGDRTRLSRTDTYRKCAVSLFPIFLKLITSGMSHTCKLAVPVDMDIHGYARGYIHGYVISVSNFDVINLIL